MAKETFIKLKFDREMTSCELNELIRHLFEYERKNDIDCKIENVETKEIAKEETTHENSGLHIAGVSVPKGTVCHICGGKDEHTYDCTFSTRSPIH